MKEKVEIDETKHKQNSDADKMQIEKRKSRRDIRSSEERASD